ncbi:orotidine-5'-phosphate decarboxylase [Alkalimarinus sediminis]|uniref:Orotidine 5'-phosphate decarboxylase n=1 Tax=Alkalimarinus sediminis TaxID=1632866 RepID=A0A9E8HL60_9ALTE|nr:orotidine-5'-phosphate decarboxylase [Alkalimarinus sediminis]UZW76663.1 orotidine-5'-phosphate decarboxylase [Alkalimarinus sediminis]
MGIDNLSPVIVALDYHSKADALVMADKLDPSQCRVKVGKELFTLCGPEILEELHKRDFEVFLDLKFHDIPNTTTKAVQAAADLGVWMVNVHASGGRRMMESCREGLEKYRTPPKLIAVTVLTSMERQDLSDIGLDVEPMEHVKRLAKLTSDAGLDGVVCSAQEVTAIREICPESFNLVTPGIRPMSADRGDQKRVMTPEEAVSAGSDYLVIGRPITQAQDPLKSLEEIVATLP